MVIDPTWITEDTESILDLFLTDNQSLVNRTEVIPGVSDHKTVYVEFSLCPTKNVTPPRLVYCYKKADFNSVKEELTQAKDEFITMENLSPAEEPWQKLPTPTTNEMKKYIPARLLRGGGGKAMDWQED